ncbi:uncharacterized mitochondrial protein AtMg00810-like [Lathyrus oleraceus]|uniref:uncharacterized mitochondrial protein AtMg00810-like n=1 Tax=Pisum sativum TaxID=3888 RepID=UPI0021D0C1C8|nr:uncharacterized mitochondrial protein AtMg00810-like [Pisum sativum]
MQVLVYKVKKMKMKYGVYVQHTSEGNMILVCLYVDNILLIGSCEHEIAKFKKVMMNEFEMPDLGNMTYFLTMEIMYSEKGITLHQLKYELELLKIFELLNYKVMVTPSKTNHKLDFDPEGDDVDATTFKQLVGSLRYPRGPISWCSKKQSVVDMSTCEAEYIVGVMAAGQVVWFLNLLQDLKIKLLLFIPTILDRSLALDLYSNIR